MASAPRSPSATPEALDVANRLRPVLLHINRHLRREAQSQGISAGQLSMLAAIEMHPGIGVGDLATTEGMSAPSVSGHIDRLEAAGYVTRVREGGGDRRRVGLAVTAAGSKILRAVRRRRTAWLAARLEQLTDDERARIAAALDALHGLVSQR